MTADCTQGCLNWGKLGLVARIGGTQLWVSEAVDLVIGSLGISGVTGGKPLFTQWICGGFIVRVDSLLTYWSSGTSEDW